MPSQKLTARFVEGVTPGPSRREYFDRLVRGLALRVSPTGGKSWVLLYRYHRRLRRWTIGRYPTLSLADARELARAGLRDVERGQDPAQAKRDANEAMTFAELADRYLTEYARPRKRTWKTDACVLRREVLPHWRHWAAREIQRRDARELVQAVALRGAPIGANRLRALLHTVFNFAIAHEIVETNPITHVPRPGVERRRDRVLTADEIRVLWASLDADPPPLAAAFRLRLITAQRGGEVHNMRWADVDLESAWWTIPGEHAKNGLPHRVPLTHPAVTLLRALQTARKSTAVYVLAGARWKRQRAEAQSRMGLANFRGLDLRRTAAGMMAGAGVNRIVIGKILNHAEPGVTAVYDRHSYDAEKRAALETWARTLTAILENTRQAANVVPIERGR